MDSEALIRFACITMPGGDPDDIAFSYLKAIDGTGLGARVMPLGALQFGLPPWSQLSHLFLSALGSRFINVVCVPAQYGLGRNTPSAIVGLFTVGIPNIAIMSGLGKYSEKELDVLSTMYDRVICPTEEGTAKLCKKGVSCATMPPYPQQLSRLFSGMTPP